MKTSRERILAFALALCMGLTCFPVWAEEESSVDDEPFVVEQPVQEPSDELDNNGEEEEEEEEVAIPLIAELEIDATLNFGTLEYGEGKSMTLTLTNNGNADALIVNPVTDIVITNPTQDVFAIEGTDESSPIVVPAEDSVELEISYHGFGNVDNNITAGIQVNYQYGEEDAAEFANVSMSGIKLKIIAREVLLTPTVKKVYDYKKSGTNGDGNNEILDWEISRLTYGDSLEDWAGVSFASTGIVWGDDLNVGTNKEVVVHGISAIGQIPANYSVPTATNGIGEITQKQLSWNGTGKIEIVEREYDGTFQVHENQMTRPTLSGIATGDSENVAWGNDTYVYDNKNFAYNYVSRETLGSLVGSSAGNYIAPEQPTFTERVWIRRHILTPNTIVLWDKITKVYDKKNEVIPTYQFVEGDIAIQEGIVLEWGTAYLQDSASRGGAYDAGAGENKKLVMRGLKISDAIPSAIRGNYAIPSENLTYDNWGTILPRELGVKISIQNKVYDGTTDATPLKFARVTFRLL